MTTQKDVNGLLSLYEASYHAFRGEQIMDVARTFSANTLQELMPSMLPHLRNLVEHTLELPLHWRAPRLETRWFIDYYARDISMCPMLLQFAKIDFNKVQAVHQRDLATVTRYVAEIFAILVTCHMHYFLRTKSYPMLLGGGGRMHLVRN